MRFYSQELKSRAKENWAIELEITEKKGTRINTDLSGLEHVHQKMIHPRRKKEPDLERSGPPRGR